MAKPFILVVDDDANVAGIITEHLERQGYRVTFCTDAAQALIQAEGLKAGLLILDIMMAGFGNGLDAYNNIRNHPKLAKDLPIIFLTAMPPQEALKVVPQHDKRVRLLHKPVPLTKLMQVIEELSQGRLSERA